MFEDENAAGNVVANDADTSEQSVQRMRTNLRILYQPKKRTFEPAGCLAISWMKMCFVGTGPGVTLLMSLLSC